MTLDKIPNPINFQNGYRSLRSLQDWEAATSIPARTLLSEALEGRLKVLIRPPLKPIQYALYRTKEDAAPLSKGPFIRLARNEIVGLIPSDKAIADLISGKKPVLDSFDAVACHSLYWDSISGLCSSSRGNQITPPGWRIGIFSSHQDLDFGQTDNIAQIEAAINPIPIQISPSLVIIQDKEMLELLRRAEN